MPWAARASAVIGTAIGWITALLGWSGYMQPTRVGQAFAQFGLHLLFIPEEFGGLGGQLADLPGALSRLQA